MNNIKREKQNYEDALLSANKLFEQDLTMQSDLLRLQNIIQKYSDLDSSRLEINKINTIDKELKKTKQFK